MSKKMPATRARQADPAEELHAIRRRMLQDSRGSVKACVDLVRRESVAMHKKPARRRKPAA